MDLLFLGSQWLGPGLLFAVCWPLPCRLSRFVGACCFFSLNRPSPPVSHAIPSVIFCCGFPVSAVGPHVFARDLPLVL